MKIGLVDVDGHHFPNLALMKLSAWHKAHGDSVEWHEPLEPDQYDKVYMKRFIDKYKDEALTMKCFEAHSSKYD